MLHRAIPGLWFLLVVNFASAQNFLHSADSLTSSDSLSIFQLLDSLMELTPEKSQLAVRMGYNSNALATGRTLGISNFGLAPALSYTHKSGVYADLTGYWSAEYAPNYYLTTLSVGYLKSFNSYLSLMAGYDHYFYHDGNEDFYFPYTNSLSLSPLVDVKGIQFSLTYTYYFGQASIHRLMPGLGYNLKLLKRKNIRIACTPMAYLLAGDETLIEIQYPETLREYLRRLRLGLPLYDEIERRVFGVMNYSFTLPVSVAWKRWYFNAGINYSIPVALPGEVLTLEKTAYLSGGIMYTLEVD